jgi:hypothetical protein
MSSVTIKRQPGTKQQRRCIRADPTQRRILLKNYEAEERPDAEQLADISQETNLCAVLIVFPTSSDVCIWSCPCASACSLPMLARCRPADWIKKWFVRKRKADGKNKTLTPDGPTLAENDPPAHTLGQVHSKFWTMDAFFAADLTSFAPSVGYIPKLYGHRKHNFSPGDSDDHTADSRGDEKEMSVGVSAGTSCAVPSGPVKNAETATSTTYDLLEALLGADAFAGCFSPSADEDTSESPPEHSNVTLLADGPGSTSLLHAAPSLEGSVYPENPYDEGFFDSESTTDLEPTSTRYPTSLIPSPLDTIYNFIPASRDLDLISTTSCSTPDDLELDSFGFTDGCLDSDLDSLPGFSGASDYTTTVLDEPSAFHESLLLQTTKQDPMDPADYSGLLGIDICPGAGADHSFFMLAVFEFCE